jgi:hypothetical protein
MPATATYETYLTRRLLDSLQLADEASSDQVREVHLQASRYYRDLLAPPGTRKAERTRVRLPARVMKKGVHFGTVIDITTQGFLLTSNALLEPETVFRLKLPGLDPVRAKVVWVEGERAGCEFMPPIHPALLDAAIAASEG